ncbi:MAG TPA: hypothetical protein VFN48_06570 [Solirubrobacteraceae bacterium]|nr:hypothetical protein [Solirubrobacteraceae bacterium]
MSALEGLRRSGTSQAAWLAGAMIANNVIALVTSVVFARLLSDYGALAALISYLIILTVAGQAMQVTTAREGVLGHLGRGPGLLRTLRAWGGSLALFTAAATVISVLARQPIASLLGVAHDPGGTWAAAAGIPAGCLFLGLSILRGALQSVGDLRSVGLSLIGEQGVRLLTGGPLAALGLGVAGAYLGSLLAYVAMIAYCVRCLRLAVVHGDSVLPAPDSARPIRAAVAARPEAPLPRAAPRLSRHVRDATVPIVALAIIQLLQNVDLIIAKHRMADGLDSSYAVAAVAAKVLIWVAMGASFALVPETSRRAAEGEDTRGVLLRTLIVLGACAIPCLAIFALAAHPLLAAVFGSRRAVAASSLLPLGAAFTVLAATYLAVQYMLALRRTGFLAAIGLIAVVEPVLLLTASRRPASFALVVLAIQVLGAALAYALALRRADRPARGADTRRPLSSAAEAAQRGADPPAVAADRG